MHLCVHSVHYNEYAVLPHIAGLVAWAPFMTSWKSDPHVHRPRRSFYFSELLIDINFVLSLCQGRLITAMIAIEIPAAIKPYSMTVALDSSFRNVQEGCSLLFLLSAGSSLATSNCDPVKSISQSPQTRQRSVR
jgi:hypothetical protein